MKKRLLALLMAGMLTASMASCVATGSQDTTGGSEDKNPIITTGGNNDKENPTEVWKTVDKTLYTFVSAPLRAEAKATGQLLVTLAAESEVHCTKQNAYWSYVECNGQSGYVANESLTDVDLLAKTFEAVEGGEKKMYVTTDNLNVRLYPASDKELSVSKVMATLKWNDEVTVVSNNGEWSRIKITVNDATKYYFVSSEYLDSAKQIDPNDETQWKHLFVDCDPTYDRYTDGSVNLREAPSLHTSVDYITLDPDTKVTVLATAQMTEESNWSYVKIEIPAQKPGDPATAKYGYINSRYLMNQPSTAPVTLESVLALYDGFEKLATEKTMYATQNVYFRSNPTNFKADYTANKVSVLAHKEAVTVVATGVYGEYNCCVFKYKVDNKEGFYFILSDYLTTDKNGTPMVTLDSLNIKYPAYTILDNAKTATVIDSVANCYLTPEPTETVPLELKQGDTVKVVALETGSPDNVWCVIQTADGDLYFVGQVCLDIPA